MFHWKTVKRCATGVAVTALTIPAGAEELTNPSDPYAVTGVGYNHCAPDPCLCPPDPCQPGSIAAPSVSTSEPTPADADGSATAPMADSVAEPQIDSTDTGPAPFDLGSLSQPSGGAGFASRSAVAAAPAPGYIDYAPVGTRFRIRYDNARGANAPTRGEYLYPTPSQPYTGAKGPNILGSGTNEIDLEELSFYFEYEVRDNVSVFIDAPIRWVGDIDITNDGNTNPTTESGFSDLRTGFRLGLIDDCDRHLTFQWVISTPTGDSERAVGTGNTSFDIGLLYDKRITDKTFVFAEFRDWFTLDAPEVLDPVSGNFVDLNSNILRYGAGVGVDLLDCSRCCDTRKLTALFEVVGWTVLDGSITDLSNTTNDIVSAEGDTIINGKYGLRYTHNDQTVYVGYGHNWSGDRWYSDLLRVEWGYNF